MTTICDQCGGLKADPGESFAGNPCHGHTNDCPEGLLARALKAEQQRDCLLAVCKEIAKADAAAFESLKSLNIEAADFSPESVEMHNKLMAAIRTVEPPMANS